jgi:hypothetical protein
MCIENLEKTQDFAFEKGTRLLHLWVEAVGEVVVYAWSRGRFT